MNIWQIIAWAVVVLVIVAVLFLSGNGHKQELWNVIKNKKMNDEGKGDSK